MTSSDENHEDHEASPEAARTTRGRGEAQRTPFASWRTHVDEAAVQIDLADLDLRQNLRRQLDTAVNVYLAARSRLGDARSDAEAGVGELRKALERVLHDLRSAYDAANDVVRRDGG